jgi:hypothetical protein
MKECFVPGMVDAFLPSHSKMMILWKKRHWDLAAGSG